MTQVTLTDKIRQCRTGVVANPYQGTDKKVLFVCSAGILRSATAARMYASKYNTRSAGTGDYALIRLSELLMAWADEIVFVNKENFKLAAMDFPEMINERQHGIRVLNIPDVYPHMDKRLQQAIEEQYEPLTPIDNLLLREDGYPNSPLVEIN